MATEAQARALIDAFRRDTYRISGKPMELLGLMADMQWHSNAELVEVIGHRFGAAKHTLEKRFGFIFEPVKSDPKKPGLRWYRLAGQKLSPEQTTRLREQTKAKRAAMKRAAAGKPSGVRRKPVKQATSWEEVISA